MGWTSQKIEERWRFASFVPAFSAGYWAFAGLRQKCQISDFIRNKPSSIFRGASQGAKGFLSRLTRYYYISRYKNVIPKYLENAPIDFAQISRTLRYILEEQARVSHFKKKSQCREIPSASEIDNDVISLLSTVRCKHSRRLILNFHPCLIKLW